VRNAVGAVRYGTAPPSAIRADKQRELTLRGGGGPGQHESDSGLPPTHHAGGMAACGRASHLHTTPRTVPLLQAVRVALLKSMRQHTLLAGAVDECGSGRPAGDYFSEVQPGGGKPDYGCEVLFTTPPRGLGTLVPSLRNLRGESRQRATDNTTLAHPPTT
jgi:hypothetical protein